MKLLSTILLCFSLFLVSCSQSEETTKPQPQPPQQQNKKEPYNITGEITIELPAVVVNGRTNLKPGSKFMLFWQDQNLGKMEVKKDGSFKLTVDRPKFQLGDEILILFNPDIQSKKIQSLYGDKGQKLKGRYLYHYSKEGIDYSGLKAGTYIDNLKIQIMENVIQSNKILEKQRQDFLNKQQ